MINFIEFHKTFILYLHMTNITASQFEDFENQKRISMIAQGYIEIPFVLSKFFGQARWIHRDELKALRAFINSDI